MKDGEWRQGLELNCHDNNRRNFIALPYSSHCPGTMFIIIRNMPLVHYDPRTHQSKLFLEGGVGAVRR